MSFAEILSNAKSASHEMVVDVIKLVSPAGTTTGSGKNFASVATNGDGDFTITLLGTGKELLGISCTVEQEAPGGTASWDTYVASTKKFNVTVWDNDMTVGEVADPLDVFDSVTIVLYWNNSGSDETI